MATPEMLISLNDIIPQDLFAIILSRLPVKSLIRFRCVAKSWKSFISDPHFIQMHLNHWKNYQHVMVKTSCLRSNPCNEERIRISYLYCIPAYSEPLADVDRFVWNPFRKPSFEILGSCNGLILISPDNDVKYIWNPSTGEYKKLPLALTEFPNIHGKVFHFYAEFYGFGYDKITQEYKVLRAVIFEDEEGDALGYVTKLQVYTLGSNSWRSIVDCIPDKHQSHGGDGKHVNGCLHWISDSFYTDPCTEILVSFNLEDEKYKEIPQPNYISDIFDTRVEVLGGCLCLIYRLNVGYCSVIWVMKDYGVKESWTKLYTFNNKEPMVMKPVKFTKNGKVLLVINRKFLRLCDPKRGTTKTLKNPGTVFKIETQTFVESLVSLNTGNFVWGLQEVQEKSLEMYKNKRKQRELWSWDLKGGTRG